MLVPRGNLRVHPRQQNLKHNRIKIGGGDGNNDDNINDLEKWNFLVKDIGENDNNNNIIIDRQWQIESQLILIVFHADDVDAGSLHCYALCTAKFMSYEFLKRFSKNHCADERTAILFFSPKVLLLIMHKNNFNVRGVKSNLLDRLRIRHWSK